MTARHSQKAFIKSLSAASRQEHHRQTPQTIGMVMNASTLLADKFEAEAGLKLDMTKQRFKSYGQVIALQTLQFLKVSHEEISRVNSLSALTLLMTSNQKWTMNPLGL